MVEVEEISSDDTVPESIPQGTKEEFNKESMADDGWQRLMGEDLMMKVRHDTTWRRVHWIKRFQ